MSSLITKINLSCFSKFANYKNLLMLIRTVTNTSKDGFKLTKKITYKLLHLQN